MNDEAISAVERGWWSDGIAQAQERIVVHGPWIARCNRLAMEADGQLQVFRKANTELALVAERHHAFGVAEISRSLRVLGGDGRVARRTVTADMHVVQAHQCIRVAVCCRVTKKAERGGKVSAIIRGVAGLNLGGGIEGVGARK